MAEFNVIVFGVEHEETYKVHNLNSAEKFARLLFDKDHPGEEIVSIGLE